jgi:hypothetical protein
LRIGADKTKRISAKIGRLRVIRVLLTRAFFYTLNFHGLRYSRDKYFDAAPSPSILSVLAFHMIRWPERSATFPSRHVVVGRSDDHRVNVLAVEDSAKIPVGLDAFEFGVIDREVYLRLEDVADRDNLRVRIPHKRLHHAAPLTPGADHADANAIIRAQDVRARRSRDADSADAPLDEISLVRFRYSFFLLQFLIWDLWDR